jgi:magnesium chelatase family protein
MMGRLPQASCEEALVVGELSLDGSVRHSRGVLPMAVVAKQQGFKRIFVPQIDAAEAALIPDMEVIPVTTLSELYGHLSGRQPILPQPPVKPEELTIVTQTDFQEIKGQEHVKRALEVAAAGGHNI